ncbi:hypothetical protein QBC43DRAFT_336194 [Cladorrhinum sp. PSN259]|nr:hypothetical protein QBC43DRAFT_336194 [Cladorrhinum sp. PSN259]
MPETVYREARYTRDTSPSDDEGYKRTTVRRYKVGPDRVEKRSEIEVVEDDRRSRYGDKGSRAGRDQEEYLEVDRRVERVYIPERPRSSFDPSPHSATYVERREVIEREREREPKDEHYVRVDRAEYRGDRGGTVVERERIVERDERDAYPERTRTVVERQIVERDDRDDYYRDDSRPRVVYEATKEIERVDRDDFPRTPREVERRSYWDADKETEVRIEKRIERRDSHGGAEVLVERRVEERRDDDFPRAGGDNIERWRKETEYYEAPQPAPAPIVIRQRAPEQRIIVQEAPPPPPVVIREQVQIDNREVVIAPRPSHDEEFYYRREARNEVGPYRERREEEYEVERYGEPRHHHHAHSHSHHRHHHHHRDGHSDYESDDGYYVARRKVIRRERSESSSPHRKRHIAEGALAGAGLSAILASRRNANGELPDHRGRKVLAGAALGALGTEVARRAHSAYEEKYADRDRSRSRSRHRSRSRSRSRSPHSRLKTGLGIAAVALAAAGAAKLYQSNKVEKEELHRGRASHRSHSVSSRSSSGHRSKSRASSVAKVGLGTAAVAGLVQHYRHKSKSRDGKKRSHSRLRTAAEIAAAGLAGAGAKKLYDKRQDKKEDKLEREREKHERELSDDEYERDERDYHRRSGSRSRSLTRSGPAYPDAESSAADPELGMVEYGAHPLYGQPAPHPAYGAGAAGYESAAEEDRRRHHRRRKNDKRGSRHDSDYSADSEPETDREAKDKKRSSSRLRDLATGGLAAGAAAFGIKKYNDKKKEKEKESDREDKDRDRDRRDRDRDGERSRDRDRERERERERERDRERERGKGKERDKRRYEDEPADDYRREQSPAHASGGAYYGTPQVPPPGGFTQHPNVASDNIPQQFYPNPPYYPGYSPQPTGVPPNSAATTNGMPPYGPPQVPPNQGPPPHMGPPGGPQNPPGPEHVSAASQIDRSLPEPAPAVLHGDKKDGVKPQMPISSAAAMYTPINYTPSTTPTAAGEEEESDSDMPGTPRTAKSVIFIPLSPKSEATLKRHREKQEAARSGAEDGISDLETPSESDTDDRDKKGKAKDTSSSWQSPLLPPPKTKAAPTSSGDEDNDEAESAVENLPDRFDSHGRPIDGSSSSSRGKKQHARRGDFEYRSPKSGGPTVMGEWGVSGTDSEAVERIVQNVTGVLEGKGSWIGLLSGILSGKLLEPGSEAEDGKRRGSRTRDRGKDRDRSRDRSKGATSDDDEIYRKKKRTDKRKEEEKGESSRSVRRRDRDWDRDRDRDRDRDDDYDRNDDDYDDHEDRKRRRRRRDRDGERDRGYESDEGERDREKRRHRERDR